MEIEKKNYTEGYERAKPFFSVYVLRTVSSSMPPEKVLSLCKKRWHIL